MNEQCAHFADGSATNDERRTTVAVWFLYVVCRLSFVVCRLSVGVVVLAVVAVYFAVVTTCGEVSDRQQGVATST